MKKNVEDFIKEHHHINYCEAIIHVDGMVEYAVPSHVEKLLKITGEDRDTVYNKMDITDSPIYWLVDYTKCIAVYTNGFIAPEVTTMAQALTIGELFDAGLVKAKSFKEDYKF